MHDSAGKVTCAVRSRPPHLATKGNFQVAVFTCRISNRFNNYIYISRFPFIQVSLLYIRVLQTRSLACSAAISTDEKGYVAGLVFSYDIDFQS